MSEIGLFKLDINDNKELTNIYTDFNLLEAHKIKQIESNCNHDVKSIEYYIKEKLNTYNLKQLKEFVHFGLTSQDINSLANTLRLKDCMDSIIIPYIKQILEVICINVSKWINIPMLSRTHGQPASPTLVGKELMVFHERLRKQLKHLLDYKYSTKFGGSVGNMNAHHVAYSNIDWIKEMDYFINSFDLERNQYTTQVDHYDNYATLFDIIRRINTILIDLNTDIWEYISLNYFKQTVVSDEVGSSTMPHKINPIDFENSEGNLLLANNLLNFLSNKLPISRLQRDLTDSTIIRNMGSSFAFSLIGYKSILIGLSKLELNEVIINKDLRENWIVVVEGIQTILRSNRVENSYELLKELTRNHEINSDNCKEKINNFIDTLTINEEIKTKLRNITPFNYLGITSKNSPLLNSI